MNDTYHNDRSRICNSQLSQLKRCPKTYFEQYVLGKRSEQTDAMLLGSMIHCMVLEPHLYNQRYSIAPRVDRRTKDGKAAWQAFQDSLIDMEPVTEEQHNTCELASNALLNHPDFATIMGYVDEFARIEQRIDFEWHGTPCRCKPDLIIQAKKLVIDLKTTKDASPRGFGYSVGDFGYHRQQAFYSHAIEQQLGEGYRFLFAVLERDKPFNAAVYEMEPLSVAAGINEINALLEELKQRTADNDWTPEWSKGIVEIGLSKWYKSGIYGVE